MPPKPPRLGKRTVSALLATTLAVLAGLAIALNTVAASNDAGAGPFDGQPMPKLFPASALGVVDRLAGPPEQRADAAARRWLAAHPVRDDAAFASYAIQTVGPPPGGARQRAELRRLHRLDAGRTPAGAATAAWLENHGKHDVWKLYLKQYRQLAAPAAGTRAKALLKRTYAMAKTIENAARAKFARPSPYIVDPSLHALNQARFAKKYSYPSKHAVIGFAEATVLSRLEPHRSAEYAWMADEIAYSRLYAGGHYPSDISAGAYLGRLIANYQLGAS